MAPKIENNDNNVDLTPEGDGSFTPPAPEANTSDIWSAGPEGDTPMPKQTVSLEEHQSLQSGSSISPEEADRMFQMYGSEVGDDLPYGNEPDDFYGNAFESEPDQGYYQDLDSNIEQAIEREDEPSAILEEQSEPNETLEDEAENDAKLADKPSDENNSVELGKEQKLSDAQLLIKQALAASAAKAQKENEKKLKQEGKRKVSEAAASATKSSPAPAQGPAPLSENPAPSSKPSDKESKIEPDPEYVAMQNAIIEEMQQRALEELDGMGDAPEDVADLGEKIGVDSEQKKQAAKKKKPRTRYKRKQSSDPKEQPSNKKKPVKKPLSARAKKTPAHALDTTNNFISPNGSSSNMLNAGTINSIPLAATAAKQAAEKPKNPYSSSSHQAKIIPFPASKRLGVHDSQPSPYNQRKTVVKSLSVNDQTFGQKYSAADRQPGTTPVEPTANAPESAAQQVTDKNTEHPNHPDNINKPGPGSQARQNMPANAPSAGGGAQAAPPRGNGVVITIPLAETVNSLANSIKGTIDAGSNSRQLLSEGLSRSVGAFHNTRTRWMDRKSPKVNIFNDLPPSSPLRNLPPLAQVALNKAYVSKNSVDRAITNMDNPRYSKGQKKSRAYDMNNNFRSYTDSSGELTRILQSDKSITPQTLEATNNYLDGMNKKMSGRADIAKNKGWLDSKNKSTLKDKMESVQNAVENIKRTVQNITSAISALSSRRRP